MVFSPFAFGFDVKRGDRFHWLAAIAVCAASLTALDIATTAAPAAAQPVSALPACAAPGPSEYLLLVVLQTEAAQGKLAETLPPSVSAPTCNYLGSRVARMGGFRTPEDADAWASYLRDAASLPAFVAKPTQDSATTPTIAVAPGSAAASAVRDPANLTTANQPTTGARPVVPQTPVVGSANPQRIAPPLDVLPPPVISAQPRLGSKIDVPQPGSAAITPATPSPQPATQRPIVPAAPRPTAASAPASIAQASTAPTAAKTPPASTSSVKTYEPKGLANGYAVLVDYGNQTSLVPLLRQLTKKPVGLASYGQRPFLMVNHTANSEAALTTLNALSRSGFRTMLVDSGKVTLLTPDVQVK